MQLFCETYRIFHLEFHFIPWAHLKDLIDNFFSKIPDVDNSISRQLIKDYGNFYKYPYPFGEIVELQKELQMIYDSKIVAACLEHEYDV